MPWKAMTSMSQRQEFVELAVQENANIRALCREFGITPRTGYKWMKRYQEEGASGLYERSRRPQHSPLKSSAVMEEAVLKVRRAHPAWGGRKIQWKLIQDGIKPPPAASTITAILARNEMLDSEESAKHGPMQSRWISKGILRWRMDYCAIPSQ